MKLWTFRFTDQTIFGLGKKRYTSARVLAPTKEMAWALIGARLNILLSKGLGQYESSVLCQYSGELNGEAGIYQLLESAV